MVVLQDELETSMRLMGVTDINQLNETYVNSSRLELELPRKVALDMSNKTASKL
jgi:hypothetical protein